jgi:Zn-finger nucleic acid-binding protein
LETLIEEEVDTSRTVSYVPCPDCGKLMNRKNYGTRAGVVVDVCKEHGVWLDGGELGALLKWVKAGGKLHHGRASAEKDRLDQRTQQQKEHLARVRELRTDPEFRRREQFDRSPLENALGALFQMMR